MKGNPAVIDALNNVLGRELVAINQYFLHARMLQDMGLAKLGKLEYDASIDEMKHADELIKRILFLEGLPNLQKLDRLRIGGNVQEILECDLEVENEACPILKDAIRLAEKEGDFTSRSLFQDILASEEDHIDWLETQLGLIKSVGVERYMQSQMNPDEAAH